MISPAQIRAARALKNWNQSELARAAGLAIPSIANIELGKQQPTARTLSLIQHTFEEHGIEFTPNDGVQRKAGLVENYQGRTGFAHFLAEVDRTAGQCPQSVFKVCNVDERLFVRWIDEQIFARHEQAMRQHDIRYRIITAEGDGFTPAESYASYRWARRDQVTSVPLYIYGGKVAFIAFSDEDVSVFVISHPVIAELCARQFDEMWVRAQPFPQPKQ